MEKIHNHLTGAFKEEFYLYLKRNNINLFESYSLDTQIATIIRWMDNSGKFHINADRKIEDYIFLDEWEFDLRYNFGEGARGIIKGRGYYADRSTALTLGIIKANNIYNELNKS